MDSRLGEYDRFYANTSRGGAVQSRGVIETPEWTVTFEEQVEGI